MAPPKIHVQLRFPALLPLEHREQLLRYRIYCCGTSYLPPSHRYSSKRDLSPCTSSIPQTSYSVRLLYLTLSPFVKPFASSKVKSANHYVWYERFVWTLTSAYRIEYIQVLTSRPVSVWKANTLSSIVAPHPTHLLRRSCLGLVKYLVRIDPILRSIATTLLYYSVVTDYQQRI